MCPRKIEAAVSDTDDMGMDDKGMDRSGPEEPTQDLGLPWEPATPDNRVDPEQGALFEHTPAVPEAPTFASGAPPRRGRSVLALVVAALVLLSAGIGIGWTLTNRTGSTSPQSIGTSLKPVPQHTGSSSANLDTQAIANRVDPGVVDITTSQDTSRLGGGGQPTAQAAGTGMILTPSGEVLTNNHVVQGANNISVTIQGRGKYSATVVGVDWVDDVALLQIKGGVAGLPTVTLADSSQLATGQRVVAIGNALGRGGTPSVTEGTISALDRSITVRDGANSIERLSGLIQFDAPISPGDSGGPLVNRSAQVVGMITAAQAAGGSQRVSYEGYAIAVNSAARIVNQIRSGQSGGNVIVGPAAFLGVAVGSLDPSTAAQLGLNGTSGALVVNVVPGTPAANAGISRNAVITAIDGHRIATPDELRPAILSHRPGDQIRVTWVDSNGSHSATVRLVQSSFAA